ncbi:MAG: TetR/AcrR family transcriptional regulator [Prolixibacteraceae bacterium]|nr:TetR/AcrR family transcriptional regulator [Prolixibacteraceae bacterium]MBN2773232.1 TetR/AcrR family transcriptional regulator [Prolixibacteraceae bacterium]
MSPRTTEQFDKIRQEKKELIMNSALELFAEKGFHATSISLIAKKAGISKGLTYNYFESKKEILDELIAHGFDTIFESFDLNHDGILTEEEFIHFIKYNFRLLKENMRHWKLFFSLLLQPSISDNFSKDYKERAEPFFIMLYNFLKSKGSTDPEGDVMVISAMLEGAFLYTVVAPEVFPLDIMEDKVINACFRIISKK